MKYLIALLTCCAAIPGALASDPASKASRGEAVAEANPTGVALGTNANLKVRASDRDAAGYYRMQIGAFEITALSDGSSPLPFPAQQLLVNVTPDEVAATLKDSFLEDPVETSINGFLVNTGTRLIFVDWQKWQ